MCAKVWANSLQGMQFGGLHFESMYVVFQSGMGAKRGGISTLWLKDVGCLSLLPNFDLSLRVLAKLSMSLCRSSGLGGEGVGTNVRPLGSRCGFTL